MVKLAYCIIIALSNCFDTTLQIENSHKRISIGKLSYSDYYNGKIQTLEERRF